MPKPLINRDEGTEDNKSDLTNVNIFKPHPIITGEPKETDSKAAGPAQEKTIRSTRKLLSRQKTTTPDTTLSGQRRLSTMYLSQREQANKMG